MKEKMKIKRIIVLSIYLGLLSTIPAFAQTPAFPGAEGFGMYTTGGRGGRVIEVTSLGDMDRYGAIDSGSFRAALNTTGEDPINIVFRVSGIIELSAELKSSRSNMTIAGQTAPGDGICIKDASVKLSGDNLIIRYMRFRPGDETKAQVSCLNIENTKNIIIDHCSFSWSIEENMGMYDNKYTTVQWCILSESLDSSFHEKGPRGYAAQWGGENASYHHNLIAHHNSRSPRFNGSHSNDFYAVQDFRNNVVYNYGFGGAIYGGENELFADTNSDGINDAGSFINFVNNYMKNGPDYSGSTFMRPSLARDNVTPQGYAEWYIAYNKIEVSSDVTADNWLGVNTSEVGSESNIRVDVPHVVDSVTTSTADEAYISVLANAGATFPIQDAVDKRVINEVKTKTGNIIDSQTEVGGWPAYKTPVADSIPADTDKDGMPDYWEDENGLDKNNVEDGKIITESGYSNLELYLNSDIPYIKPTDPVSSSILIHSSSKLEIDIFPNPSSDYITINSPQVITQVEIYGMDSKIISEYIINASTYTLPIKEIPIGVYFLKATNQEGDFSINKLLKK